MNDGMETEKAKQKTMNAEKLLTLSLQEKWTEFTGEKLLALLLQEEWTEFTGKTKKLLTH